MAAFNKLGSLLRHSTLTSGAPASSSPALFSVARLMSTKLFVGGEFLLFGFFDLCSEAKLSLLLYVNPVSFG